MICVSNCTVPLSYYECYEVNCSFPCKYPYNLSRIEGIPLLSCRAFFMGVESRDGRHVSSPKSRIRRGGIPPNFWNLAWGLHFLPIRHLRGFV